MADYRISLRKLGKRVTGFVIQLPDEPSTEVHGPLPPHVDQVIRKAMDQAQRDISSGRYKYDKRAFRPARNRG